MIILNEKLLSPKEVAEAGLLSLTAQWSLRKSGDLTYLRIGKKIFYRESDIQSFLGRCEVVGKDKAKAI